MVIGDSGEYFARTTRTTASLAVDKLARAMTLKRGTVKVLNYTPPPRRRK